MSLLNPQYSPLTELASIEEPDPYLFADEFTGRVVDGWRLP